MAKRQVDQPHQNYRRDHVRHGNQQLHKHRPPQLGSLADEGRRDNHFAVTGPKGVHSAVKEGEADAGKSCDGRGPLFEGQHILADFLNNGALNLDGVINGLGK